MKNLQRTQICLEGWQYQFLTEKAKETGCSIARIVRDIISKEALSKRKIRKDDPIFDIVGIGEGDGKPVARNHDDYLYGT